MTLLSHEKRILVNRVIGCLEEEKDVNIKQKWQVRGVISKRHCVDIQPVNAEETWENMQNALDGYHLDWYDRA